MTNPTNTPSAAVSASTPAAGALRRRAAAALLALGGLAGAALVQAQPAPAPASGPMHGHHHMHGGPMGGRAVERMLDRVNATAEQRTQIRAVLDAARAEQRAQAPARRQLHEQALALLAQPTIDTAALENLRQQQLVQHDQASQRQLRTMVEVANVLTPQQRAQIAQEMRQRAAEHERRR